MSQPRILYCNCSYAQVVPPEVKEAVLRRLCESDVSFDAVADLCEMSARQDPSLQSLAQSDGLKVVACFPRAVKWLFASGKAPLDLDKTEVLNMRTQSAEEVISGIFNPAIQPNLPRGKVTAASAPAPVPESISATS